MSKRKKWKQKQQGSEAASNSVQVSNPLSEHNHSIEARSRIVAQSFSGPLPPPQVLAQYNAVVPGAAERILLMAEEQSLHRRLIEKRVITWGLVKSILGVIFGLIVALGGLAAGTYITVKGNALAGSFLNLGSLGGLVYTFVVGVNQTKEDLKKKRKRR